MPRIPTYEQQSSTPGVGRVAQIGGVPRLDDSVARAAGNAAQSAQNWAGALTERKVYQQRAKEQQDEQDALTWVGKTLADSALEWKQYEITARETAAPGGAGHTPKLAADFDAAMNKTLEAAPSPRAKAILAERMQNFRSSLVGSALEWESGARRSHRMGQVEQAIGSAAKLAEMDPSQFASSYAEQISVIEGLDIPPGDRDALTAKANDMIAGAAVLGMVRRDPRATLKLLSAEKETGNMAVDSLDIQDKVRLRNAAETEVHRMEAEQRAKAAEARSEFSMRLADSQAKVMTLGYDPNPPTRSQFIANYGPKEGARMADRYERVAQIGSDRVAVAGMSLAEQNELLAARKPKAGDPDYKASYQAYESLAQAVGSVRQQVSSDPIAFAAQSGRVGDLNFADPAAFASELKRRAAVSDDLSQNMGVERVLLSKGEQQSLTQNLSKMTPVEKTEFLRNVRGALPDPESYQAIMRQIRPDSPVTATAGSILGVDNEIEVSPGGMFSDAQRMSASDVAARIIEGEDLLNPPKDARGGDGKPKLAMPKDADLRRAWSDYASDAYAGAPGVESTSYQAFRAFYASEAARAGKYGGEFDPDIASKAARAATGGVADFNDSRIVLPWGMSENQVVDGLYSQWPSVAKSAGLPPNTPLESMRLRTVADGVYAVMEGAGPLRDAQGRPVTLSIERSSPYADTDVPQL